MQDNNPAVRLSHITKTYRTCGAPILALRDISLTVNQGAILCIMGPSGSGKTTLLKIAAGYLHPDEGEVRLLGTAVYAVSTSERLRLRRALAFMFQEDLLIDTLNLEENVELPLIIEGIGRTARRKAVQKALEAVGLQGKEDRKPDQVSGGERRRASLARCLVNEPTILFADEPTSNLDSQTALHIVQTLQQLNHTGLTTIISTHDHLVATHLGNTLYLRDGVILSEG